METLSKVFEDKYNKNVKDCTNEEIYHGLLSWTKEQLKGRGYQEGKKKIYYISAEFLIGKLLSNNLINLGVYDEVAKYLKENGKELSMIEGRRVMPMKISSTKLSAISIRCRRTTAKHSLLTTV